MFAEVLFALLLGLIVASLLVGPAGRRGPGPWSGFGFFFLILFFFIWAAGVWITPVGPHFYGASWATFLVSALLLFLLFAALLPPSTPRRHPADPEMVEPDAAAAVVGVVFWLLLVGLILAIVAAYI
ncbi:MAG: hypothetical protein R3200_12530 [Xanthomonadales bacterium]|nr:hypothetical protein [Xanthomonadales bacterium]